MKKLGLMKGEVEDIVSSGAHALFMPHGLGHMMGMTVHDMENFGEINVGYDEGEEKSTQFGLASLRLAKKLEIGNVFTIEPGIYFIPELFEKWKNEKLHQEFLNYDEIEKYMDFGGIRMERDILIQEDGTSRILGDKFPRTADEIEGINDYNYYFVPFIVQIIYTTKGRIFTLPGLTNEGQERVTEIIYDFLYQAEKEKDEKHTTIP